MTYDVIIAPKAEIGLAQLFLDEPKAYRKALKLISELYEHPRSGTGKPEPLRGD